MLKRFIKENTYTIMVFFMFLSMFLLGWLVFGFVMPKNGEAHYGNRLDDITEDIKITEQQTNKMVEELKKNNIVTKASVDNKGRIINVLIEVKSNAKLKEAKALSKIVLENMEDKQKSKYDVQIFITNESDKAKGYPVIGYKNSSDKGFTF